MISRFREVIQKSGFSYVELEKKTGISKSALHRYATGNVKKVPVNVIEKVAEVTQTNPCYLAKFLGTTPAYLMGWNTVSPEQQLSEVYLNLALKAQRHNIAPINIEMAIAFIQSIREKYPESR